jgi:hypothetical protein
MTQYDAGPGDWSDREWEDPDKKPQPHAKRRRVALPPWALLAILVGIVIILCVSLVLVVRALRKGGDRATPPPVATASAAVPPTATRRPGSTTAGTPTATVVLPIEGTVLPTPFTEIAVGATVVVKGTQGTGLNLRQQPTTYAKILASAKEGAELTVMEGPKESDGFVWWRLRTSDGKEGWGAGEWLALKTE